MPEPNTVAAPPGPDPPEKSTAGWVRPPAPAAGADPSGDTTLTRTVASTPGPADPERHTQPEDTEPLVTPPTGDLSALPAIPGYYIDKLLGIGGMGVVYRAIDLTLNRVVAIKVMQPRGRDPGHVQGRFDREVTALAAIDHPNIVRIFDADEWHGFPYFTMQYVSGGPLSHHLGRFRGNHPRCARLMAKVARAVQVLHDHNVIHRDLKPLNILLGDNDEPMVADFGLAKWLDDDPQSDYSVTGHPVGTRQYMAPEQTLGKRTDYAPACDIWSMGVVLYELLGGRRPFVDDGKSDLLKRIREESPPSLPDDVPADLAGIVEKCLAKNPAERYATAAAVAEDLECWLRGEPLRVARVKRRRGWPLALGLIALLGLIAVPAVVMSRNEIAKPPAKTAADRILAGETLYLTDKTGKPTTAATPLRGEVLQGNRDGFHVFTSRRPGMLQLLNEPLPLPLRLEGEIAVTFAPAKHPFKFGGVYLGEKQWPGPFVHNSALQCLAYPFGETQERPARFIKSTCEMYWWEEQLFAGSLPLHEQDSGWGRDPKKDAEPRFVPIMLDVRTDEVRTTIDGKPSRRIASTYIRSVLHIAVERNPRLVNYPFAQPLLGDGIGITLNDTELIVRNLRLKRLDP